MYVAYAKYQSYVLKHQSQQLTTVTLTIVNVDFTSFKESSSLPLGNIDTNNTSYLPGQSKRDVHSNVFATLFVIKFQER